MKTKKKNPLRAFLSLSPAERDREVARFDHPIDLEREARPLTRKERAIFEKARGCSLHTFEFNKGLMRKALSAAQKNGLTVDEFVAQAIRGALSPGKHPPAIGKTRRSA
jgi:hypothetical protein